MKMLSLLIVIPILSSSMSAIAGDGAENVSISVENSTSGVNVAATGGVDFGGIGIQLPGQANAGSVVVKSSAVNSNVIISNTSHGVTIALGNSNSGSAVINTTNNLR